MIDFVDLLNQRIYAKYQFSKGLLYWMDVVLSCATAFRLITLLDEND